MQNSAVFKSVFKSYDKRPVLHDLTVELPQGRFIVLLGKNGAGKSTFLRTLTGLEGIDRGDILLLDSNLEEEDLERRRAVSYISELLTLPYKLNVSTEIARELYPLWDVAIFERFMMTFGLNLGQAFLSLSRGQRIQYLFAVAAASRPKLYVLDEVTSVLDAHARFEVMNFLKSEVDRGATVILATNIATETHGFGNFVCLIDEGKVALATAVEDLRKRFQKFRLPPASLREANKFSDARAVHTNHDGTISYIMPMAANSAPIDEEWKDRRAITIEDLFVYYTGTDRGIQNTANGVKK